MATVSSSMRQSAVGSPAPPPQAQFGQVVDVFVSARRDADAARRFFEWAIGATMVTPSEVTTDRAPAYVVVLAELLPAAWGTTPIGTPTTASSATTAG